MPFKNFRISEKLSNLPTLQLGELTELQGELKDLLKNNYAKLKSQIEKKGFRIPVFVWVNPETNENLLLDGTQRRRLLIKENMPLDTLLPVVYIEASSLEDAKETLLAITSQYGTITQEGLDTFAFDLDALYLEEMVHFDALRIWEEELANLPEGNEQEEDSEDNIQDSEPQIDKAEELNKVWCVESGDVWRIGEHSLVCGDSTKQEDVAMLMGDGISTLIHADPPYGMGKEKDGIANDNLYAGKLDAFQMSWWRVWRKHLADNGSAYIWGNAEDLWRLWYCGGLKDSERLTFRNQIVWDKKHGQGMLSGDFRMYPTVTEHCLFFMVGEQGFNNNADNYFEGWEPIRLYLFNNCEKAKIKSKQFHKILSVASNGGGMYSHHISATGSQWAFITEGNYKKLQNYCQQNNIDAFKREYDELKKEYDELKKEWYATRAYFDNTHDNMSDVWEYQRVQGEERWEHATPKPAKMVMRAIKSSSQNGDIVMIPFAGSGSDFVACENASRKGYGMEISPNYCAVVLERMKTAFPHLIIERISTNS
jgi:DNA modification methylase